MEIKRRGFLRIYVFPALFLFALPLLAYAFSQHARTNYDDQVRDMALQSVAADASLDPAQRQEAQTFYTATPASVVCEHSQTNPELAEAIGVCGDYAQFRWMRSASVISLALGVGSVLFALACSALAFWSRPAQYWSFRIGWNVLRVTCSIQVVLQGALAVALSYWVTALWMNIYVPKLILAVGLLALMGMYFVIVAIFARAGGPLSVEGGLVLPEDAPELWAHVRQLCQRLGTSPPDYIIGGIDDNFFVTEGDVELAGQVLSGRTLFVSLSLLKTLDRAEADAVLAHEMAHFSGGDTAHSKKLVPLLTRYAVYLNALAVGVLSLPIFYFMLFYWALFQVSLGKSSRERELRADHIAAEQTSNAVVANALLRVGAYSGYRARVESKLFAQQDKPAELDIPKVVQEGLASYVSSPDLNSDLHERTFPHPFDSHPTLKERFDALSVALPESEYGVALSRPAGDSWYSTISSAAELERRLWETYQQRFAANHELALAYRYRPATEQERAIVVKHFPPCSFPIKQGEVTLTFERIAFPSLPGPIEFDQVKKCSVVDGTLGDKLVLVLQSGAKHKLALRSLGKGRKAFLQTFQRYYGRHLAMLQHQVSS